MSYKSNAQGSEVNQWINSNVSNKSSVKVLALWSNSDVFAVEYSNPKNPSSTIIGINASSVSSRCVDTCWRGDGSRLFLNALIYAATNKKKSYREKMLKMIDKSQMCDIVLQFKY